MFSFKAITIKFSKFFLLTALFMSLPVLLTAQNMDSAEGDRQALVDLYNSTNGDQWTNNSGWLSGNPSSSWFGVEVNSSGRVVKLDLFKNNLSGTLPESIGNLTKVEFVNIKHNKLTGQIPSSIGNLENVDYLLLAGAAFSDERGVPSVLRDHYASKIDWKGNTFSGEIPPELGNLKNMKFLDLSRNNFTGGIPPEIGNATSLVGLYLNANSYTTIIPPELGNLVNLKHLQIHGGHHAGSNSDWPDGNPAYIGTLPEELGKLTNLRYVRMARNRITGGLPDGWKNAADLVVVEAERSSFDGAFPTIFTEGVEKPYLRGILFDFNNFSGVIPPEISKFNLGTFKFADNNLSGTIPEALFQMSNMIILTLSGNNLEGEIPTDLSNLKNIRNIYLGGNNLTGRLPQKWPDSENYVIIDFSRNQFTGSIPPEMQKLTQSSKLDFKGLWLNDNELTGEVPGYMADFKSDVIISIQNNKFTFDDILPNFNTITSSVKDFEYDEQKHFGNDKVLKNPAGESVTLEFPRTSHPDNDYQWMKDGQSISGANSRTLSILSMSESDPGTYTLRITNSQIPDMVLQSSEIILEIGESSGNDGGSTVPEAPSTLSPANGAINISQTPRFEWSSVDADTYILTVENTGSSATVVDREVSGTSFTITDNLDFETVYSWRVRGVNDGNEGDWSAAAEFTTLADDDSGSGTGGEDGGDTPIQAPSILTPEDGEENVSLTPLLSWSNVEADYYILHLDSPDMPGPYELIINEQVSGTSYSVIEELNLEWRYTWRVRGVKDGAEGEWSPVAEFTTTASEEEAITMETELDQNYPNPFNPSTQIRFSIGEAQQVSLKVYDMAGRLVANLLDGSTITAGSHEVTFNANNMASGIYFYRFITESEIVTRKMTLMK